jgi:hypothetical protein
MLDTAPNNALTYSDPSESGTPEKPKVAGSPARGLSVLFERHVTTPRSLTPPPLNPAFDSVASVPVTTQADADGPRWHIGQTQSRAEKLFAWHLHDAGVAYFLPMEQVRRVSHRKAETFYRIAFPGYVFFAGDESAVDRAEKSLKLCRVIRVRDQWQLQRDLCRAQLAFGAKLEDAPEVDPSTIFRKGTKCRVKAPHALQGSEAWVDVVTKRGQIVVSITVLGASRPVEIDPQFLEPW